MALKNYKPTSAGRRAMTAIIDKTLAKKAPEKNLTVPLKSTGGRNMYGRITSRHRGAGHKRQYRLIDFTRAKEGMTAKVVSLEYDPNRTSRIALLQYLDGQRTYILAPEGLKVGDQVRVAYSGSSTGTPTATKVEVMNSGTTGTSSSTSTYGSSTTGTTTGTGSMGSTGTSGSTTGSTYGSTGSTGTTGSRTDTYGTGSAGTSVTSRETSATRTRRLTWLGAVTVMRLIRVSFSPR